MSTTGTGLRRSTGRVAVTTVREGRAAQRFDELAAEEPMEIRAGGPGQEPVEVAVTMRTPGRDFELAAGFLFTEGLVGRDEIDRVSYCDSLDGEQDFNVVTIRLRRPFDADVLAARNFYATSSCGICGKASLDEVAVRCEPLGGGPVVPRSLIETLPGALRGRQRIFSKTGGLHAAGLFDPEGAVLVAREDVGRHNAVDKVIGARLLAHELPAAGTVMMVSGRLSFEIVQKAAVAGIPILCAVSAPSSLAVDAAERLGVTAVGFLRARGFNVYTRPERIDLDR